MGSSPSASTASPNCLGKPGSAWRRRDAASPGDVVHPGYAGHGIGRALLTVAHGALRASGCPEAFLFVHEGNERALDVYAAAGYHPDGTDRVSDFRGTRIRELRLVKQL